MTAEKKYLFVSDIHAGSLYGLMRERTEIVNTLTGENSIVHANAGQRYLLKHWKDMVRKVGEVDCCIINGDTCDGIQRKIGRAHV